MEANKAIFFKAEFSLSAKYLDIFSCANPAQGFCVKRRAGGAVGG